MTAFSSRSTAGALALGMALTLGADLATGAGDASPWPQWRGPQRDARIRDAAPWPSDLRGLQPSWRVELGPSYSGPVVSDKAVFITETRSRQDEVVHAFDRGTGKSLWQAEWTGAMSVPFFARANGDWIRSTPVFDGSAVFVAGMRDVLVCIDAATGSQRWTVDFVERYGTPLPAFGFVCSPLVDGRFVYVQAGGSFVKLDKTTGETVWRVLVASSGMMDSAFSSPLMCTIRNVRQLLVQTRQQLVGVDPESGSILWSQEVPAFRGMNILTPTVYGNGILTSTHRNATYFYNLDHDGSSFEVTKAWENKVKGYMSSPVVIGDHAYLHLGNGRFSCIDLRSGETAWRSSAFGKYCSMVVNGETILALTERGELLLIAANPAEFKLLDRRQVAEDDTWAHLAIAGDQVFVRELGAIAAFKWQAAALPAQPSSAAQPSE